MSAAGSGQGAEVEVTKDAGKTWRLAGVGGAFPLSNVSCPSARVCALLEDRKGDPAIAAAVIGGVSMVGGQGRVIGVVAGAALLVILRDGLVAVNVNAYYQSMVVGVGLLAAIVTDRFRVDRLGRAGVRFDRRHPLDVVVDRRERAKAPVG